MKRNLSAAALAACVIGVASPLHAQQVQWTQTLNLPKGHNLPRGIVADVLGIGIGDTYAEAKPKLEKLLAEVPPAPKPQQRPSQRVLSQLGGASNAPPFEEIKQVLFLPLPDGTRIEASYVGRIILRRQMAGTGNRKIEEMIQVHFSAPSSGHQVLAVERSILYAEQGDQPRIGEIIAALKQKFKSEPKIETGNTGASVYFTFDNGAAYVPKEPHNVACGGLAPYSVPQADIPRINPKGRCDVVMQVRFNHGISPDHASAVWFNLHDYERGKANLSADYAFFVSYIAKLQSRTGAPPPKL